MYILVKTEILEKELIIKKTQLSYCIALSLLNVTVALCQLSVCANLLVLLIRIYKQIDVTRWHCSVSGVGSSAVTLGLIYHGHKKMGFLIRKVLANIFKKCTKPA